MRLNRVLLLAAAMSMAFVAMVFTISCSDGEKGADGASCVVSDLGDGKYDVLCGGASVGTLGTPNGQTGPQGPQGIPGPDCELSAGIGGTYQVTCAGVVKGLLEGCHTEENLEYKNDGDASTNEVIITCLGSTVVGLCGNPASTFNPSLYECEDGKTVSDGLSENYCGLDSLKYNSHFQYCGFLNEAALKAGTPTLLKRCPITDPSTYTHQPNEAKKDVDDWNLLADIEAPEDTVWQNEFCQVSLTLNEENDPTITVDTVYSVGVPELCGGSKVKLNENAWKREYCGYASEDALIQTVVKNACGDGEGPDADAYGEKFCGMRDRADKFTYTRSEEEGSAYGAFCLVGADSVRTPMNAVAKDKVTSADWKDEYCGYANKAAGDAGLASVRTGICGNGEGPNNIDDGWDNDYCQGTSEENSYGKRVATGKTERVYGAAAYCMKDADANYQTANSSARFNEGKWLSQYCGYASKADADADPANLTRLTGVCDDGNGPNSDGWNAEFCQVQWEGREYNVTKRVPFSGSSTGNGTFCLADDKMPTTQSYGQALNKDTWQGQYCGFTSADAYERSLVSTNTTFRKKLVTNGICKDGVYNYTTNAIDDDEGKPNESAWNNEFCQWTEDGKQILVKPASVTDAAKLLELFCIADTTGFGAASGVASYYKQGGNPAAGNGTTINGVLGFSAAKKFTNTSNRLNVTKPAAGKYQYCGYASYAGACNNGNCATYGTNGNLTFARYDALCTDATVSNKPNKILPSADDANKNVAAGRWLNQYCQGKWEQQTSKTTVASLLKFSGGTTAKNDDYTEACIPSNIDVASVTTASGNLYKLNSGSWQGQYCTPDGATKSCPAGQLPNADDYFAFTTPSYPHPGNTVAGVYVSPLPRNDAVGAVFCKNPSAPEIKSISITTQPIKTAYTEGEKIDLAGLAVAWTLTNNTSGSGDIAAFKAAGGTVKLGGRNVDDNTRVKASDGSTFFRITLGAENANSVATNNLALTKIGSIVVAWTDPTTKLVEGQTFKAADLTASTLSFTLKDASGSAIGSVHTGTTDLATYGLEVTVDGATIPADGILLTSAGLTIKVGQTSEVASNPASAKSGTAAVTVDEIGSVEVSTSPTLSYIAGDKLDLSGMVVKLKNSGGTYIGPTTISYASFADYSLIAKIGTATVDNNTVLVVADGGQEIAVSSSVNTAATAGQTGALTVKEVGSIKLTGAPTVSYTQGDKFDAGTLKYQLWDNGSTPSQIGSTDYPLFDAGTNASVDGVVVALCTATGVTPASCVTVTSGNAFDLTYAAHHDKVIKVTVRGKSAIYEDPAGTEKKIVVDKVNSVAITAPPAQQAVGAALDLSAVGVKLTWAVAGQSGEYTSTALSANHITVTAGVADNTSLAATDDQADVVATYSFQGVTVASPAVKLSVQ